MNPRDFCYWLRGYMELCEADSELVVQGCDALGYKKIGKKEFKFTAEQWKMIMEHLDKVFNYETNIVYKAAIDYDNNKRLCDLKRDENDRIITSDSPFPNMLGSPLSYLFYSNAVSC